MPSLDRILLGATGFIAVQAVKTLIDHGYNVVGTVRSSIKGQYLVDLFGSAFSYAVVTDIESVCT